MSDSYSDLYLSQHGDVVFSSLWGTRDDYLPPPLPIAPDQKVMLVVSFLQVGIGQNSAYLLFWVQVFGRKKDGGS